MSKEIPITKEQINKVLEINNSLSPLDVYEELLKIATEYFSVDVIGHIENKIKELKAKPLEQRGKNDKNS